MPLSGQSAVASSAVALRRTRDHTFGIIVAISAVVLLPALLGDPLTALLSGSRLAESAPGLQIMCLGVVTTMVGYPFHAVLFAERRTVVFPAITLLSAAATLGGKNVLRPLFGAKDGATPFAVSGPRGLIPGAGYRVPRQEQSPGGRG